MKKFKIFALLLVMAMCLSLFAGCNNVFPPKNAVELVKRSAEVMDGADNYRMDVSMSMSMYMEGDIQGIGMELSMPIEMEMTYDRAGNYKHGNMEMDAKADITISFMGETETQSEDMSSSSEMYAVLDGDEVTTYTNKDNEGWVYVVEDAEDSTSNMGDILKSEGDDSIFSDAEMEKGDGEYTVSLKMSNALKNDDFVDFMKESLFSSLSEEDDFDWDEFADAVGDAKVVFTFESETWRMTGLSIKGVEIDDISFMSGFEGMDLEEINIDEMSMTIDMDVKFSKFGEIDADDVEVPKKVKKEAVEEDEFEEPIDYPDEPVDDPYEDSDTTEPSETEPKDPVEDPTVPAGDMSFYYNVTRLGIPTDYSVFTNDGWYAVEDGEYSSFLCMENTKYPDITLYLNTVNGEGTVANVSVNGSDGFGLGIYKDTVNAPNLSFAGIKFGDSLSDVTAVLGKAEYSYSFENYEGYSWTIIYDGRECELGIALENGCVTEFEITAW